MFASSKAVWHLPVALLSVSLALYFLIGIAFDAWVSALQAQYPEPALFDALSSNSVEALNEDALLNHPIISLTDTVAQASSDNGEQDDFDGLGNWAKGLKLARIRNAQPREKRRSLLGRLGNFVRRQDGDENEQQDEDSVGGALQGLGQLLGIGGGNSTGGLSGLLAGAGDAIKEKLATPALFWGIGIGMGIQTSLNLTSMEQAQIQATNVASVFNATPTGINTVAQNLGSGMSAQLVPSLGNLTSGGGGEIGMAAYALAQGIGRGSASGLNLTQRQFQPSNGSGIMAIAGNIGLGVSFPIASNIDFQKLVALSGASGEGMMAQLPQIVGAAGKGLGQGASAGLGLSKPNSTLQRRQAGNDTDQIDVPGTIQDFSRGFSQSFLESANLSKAVEQITPDMGNSKRTFNITYMTGAIAAGAGRGIGEGAAVGLGFQQEREFAMIDIESGQSTELITAAFARNVVAGFLANGTADVAFNSLASGAGGLTMNIQPSKVAEGLARGLIEGGVNAISGVGGIENVISGNFSLEMVMTLPSMNASLFNDSVNGSAVAFARGLGGEGTLLIASMITNSTRMAVENGSLSNDAGLVRRQKNPDNPDDMSLAANETVLSSLAQAGTSALTCQGFGGMAAMWYGLQNSGTIQVNTGSAVPLDEQTLAALPTEPITIMSEGNRFEINVQDGEVEVNGIKFVSWAAYTGLHVFLTTFAFFYALPAYLALGAMLRLSVLIGYPLSEEYNKKWRKIILLAFFTPTAVIGILLGVVGMGNSFHFRSMHAILGLVSLVLIAPVIFYSLKRLRCTATPPPTAYFFKTLPVACRTPARPIIVSSLMHQVLLQVGTASWITGFTELRSITLCVSDTLLTAPLLVSIITGLIFIQISATALIGIRFWIEQRIGRIALGDSENASTSIVDSFPLPPPNTLKRSDSMQTFGFDEKDPTARNTFPPTPTPPARTYQDHRPSLQHRTTADLLGQEDSNIGWPSRVRKFGEEDTMPARGADSLTIPTRNSTSAPDQKNSNPDDTRFSPTGRRLTYNEKLGGYETERSSAVERDAHADTDPPRYDNDTARYTVSVGYGPNEDVEVTYPVAGARSPYGYGYGEFGYAAPYAAGEKGSGDLESGRGDPGAAAGAPPVGGPNRYRSFSRPRPSEDGSGAGYGVQRGNDEPVRGRYGEVLRRI